MPPPADGHDVEIGMVTTMLLTGVAPTRVIEAVTTVGFER
jgi:hypothetical protein